MKYWVAFADIDGFRLDAAKHVTDDFLAYFSTSVRAYSKTIGKDNFMVLGEVAASSSWEARTFGNFSLKRSSAVFSSLSALQLSYMV